MVIRDPALPDEVTIYEVGARDGLQNEATVVPVEVKAEFLQRLARAGLKVVEATSFVHPRWVPQLADAADLLRTMVRVDGVDYPVLVPNERGLDRALAAGVRHIAIFASATETFAKRNLNRTLDETVRDVRPGRRAGAAAGAAGARLRVDVLRRPVGRRGALRRRWPTVARRLVEMGCTQLSLGDTIGTGTPGARRCRARRVRGGGVRIGQIAVHFHDTYGQALANTLAALRRGVTTVDASAGGLGGCPYAESATGNLATEDLVWMLDGMGIRHGVDLDALVATSTWMAAQLGRPSPSNVVRALAHT